MMKSFLFLCLLHIGYGAKLELTIQDRGMFGIKVDGKTWFQTSAPFATVNGDMYTVNDTKNTLKKVGTSETSRGSDQLGIFSRYAS